MKNYSTKERKKKYVLTMQGFQESMVTGVIIFFFFFEFGVNEEITWMRKLDIRK